jgi:hypothetical protein
MIQLLRPGKAAGMQFFILTIYSNEKHLRRPLALANIKDLQPPEIRVAVAGRVLSFTDYAAKDKPFSILISDPSGIDPKSVSVFLNGKAIGF